MFISYKDIQKLLSETSVWKPEEVDTMHQLGALQEPISPAER